MFCTMQIIQVDLFSNNTESLIISELVVQNVHRFRERGRVACLPNLNSGFESHRETILKVIGRVITYTFGVGGAVSSNDYWITILNKQHNSAYLTAFFYMP